MSEDVRNRFIGELSAFYLTYQKLIGDMRSGAGIAGTAKLRTISTMNSPEDNESKLMRLTREDGQYFDLLVDPTAAYALANAVSADGYGDAH